MLLSNEESNSRKMSATKSLNEDVTNLTDSVKPASSVCEPVKERKRKNIMPDVSKNLE
jgi:hypothetical protein